MSSSSFYRTRQSPTPKIEESALLIPNCKLEPKQVLSAEVLSVCRAIVVINFFTGSFYPTRKLLILEKFYDSTFSGQQLSKSEAEKKWLQGTAGIADRPVARLVAMQSLYNYFSTQILSINQWKHSKLQQVIPNRHRHCWIANSRQ